MPRKSLRRETGAARRMGKTTGRERASGGVPTIKTASARKWWARRQERAFAHPTMSDRPALAKRKIPEPDRECAVDQNLEPAEPVKQAGRGRVQQDQRVEAVGDQAAHHHGLERFRATAVAG